MVGGLRLVHVQSSRTAAADHAVHVRVSAVVAVRRLLPDVLRTRLLPAGGRELGPSGVVQLLATDRPDRDGGALRARRRRDRASLGTPSRSQRVLAWAAAATGHP